MKKFACAALMLFCTQATWAAPLLTNPDFSSGTTGWGTLGNVSPSTGGLLSGSYVVLEGSEMTQSNAENSLGLNFGGLNFLGATTDHSFSVVFQDIGGTFSAADILNFSWGGLSNEQSSPLSLAAVGVVDLTTATVVSSITPTGGTIDGLGTQAIGTDGFFVSYGPDPGRSIQINTTNPARVFALIARIDSSAVAFTMAKSRGPGPTGVPEIDPGAGAVPLALSLGIVTILIDRRRQAVSV